MTFMTEMSKRIEQNYDRTFGQLSFKYQVYVLCSNLTLLPVFAEVLQTEALKNFRPETKTKQTAACVRASAQAGRSVV